MPYYGTIYTQHLFYISAEHYLSAVNPAVTPEEPLCSSACCLSFWRRERWNVPAVDGKALKCNCWVPSRDARREQLRPPSCRATEELTNTFLIKSPFFHNSSLLCALNSYIYQEFPSVLFRKSSLEPLWEHKLSGRRSFHLVLSGLGNQICYILLLSSLVLPALSFPSSANRYSIFPITLSLFIQHPEVPVH